MNMKCLSVLVLHKLIKIKISADINNFILRMRSFISNLDFCFQNHKIRFVKISHKKSYVYSNNSNLENKYTYISTIYPKKAREQINQNKILT